MIVRAIPILIAILFSKLIAYSCDCPAKPAIDSAIRNSELIISGKILQRKTVKIIRSYPYEIINPDSIMYVESSQQGEIYKFTVLTEDIFKGKNKDTVCIYSEISEGMCGYNFNQGERYIIYAKRITYNNARGKKVRTFFTSMCTRTGRYSKEEIEVLSKMLRKK